MQRLGAMGMALIAAAAPAPALAQAEYSGKLTKSAQILDAPGPYPSGRGTIAAGTPVEAEVCFEEGEYCLIRIEGTSAFVEGRLIAVPVGEGTSTALELEQAKWERIRKQAALPRTPDWERRNIVVWGDSLSTDTFGDELEALLLGRSVSMQGVPGEDGGKIAARMLADTRYTGRLKVIWDRHYTNEGVELYLADLARMTDHAAQSGDFVVISDIADLDGVEDENGKQTATAAADAALTDKINAALRQRYPDRFLDVTGILSDPATRTDGLHLTQAGNDAVASAIAAFIRAKSL